MCLRMFITSLFIIANLEQFKYLSTQEWVNKNGIAIQYYSSIKKNEILIYTTTWIDFNNT